MSCFGPVCSLNLSMLCPSSKRVTAQSVSMRPLQFGLWCPTSALCCPFLLALSPSFSFHCSPPLIPPSPPPPICCLCLLLGSSPWRPVSESTNTTAEKEWEGREEKEREAEEGGAGRGGSGGRERGRGGSNKFSRHGSGRVHLSARASPTLPL